MANRIAAATGNFGTAGTWGTADTTMIKTDGTTSTNVTTANLDSGAFTPGAITIDGVLLNIASRVASPTGTMTVTLRNSTAGSNVTSVTINNSDLPAVGTSAVAPGAWIFFKFSASQTLLAATNYVIRITSSVTSQCALYAGASNAWNLLVRTTTTGAPAVNDRLWIQREYLSAGSSNALTVTMDNNATTDFGKIDISTGGTVTYSTSGNTQLRTSGNLDIWAGGTLNIGTTGTPIPSGTTAILEFDCTANVEFGLEVREGGNLVIQGVNKSVKWCKLGADASAGATSLTSATSLGTNWKNTDSILLTSTTRTASEAETKALTADSSGTSLTIAAITNAHGGNSTTKVQGEIGNLTCNTILRAVSTFSWYMRATGGATVDIDWAEFIDVGSATAQKRGIDIATTGSGSYNFQYSTIRNCDTASAFMTNVQANAVNITIQNNIFYSGTSSLLNVAGAVTGTWDISNNLFCRHTTGNMVDLATGYNGLTFNNNVLVSAGAASTQALNYTASSTNAFVSMSGNECHSGAGYGFSFASTPSTFQNLLSWRNTSAGVVTNGLQAVEATLTVDTMTIFGNATSGIEINTSLWLSPLILSNLTVDAGVTLTQPVGIDFVTAGTAYPTITMSSCNFGTNQSHATADIRFNTSPIFCEILMYACTLASATEVSTQTNMRSNAFIRSSRHDNTAGAYKAWFKYGTIVNDTSTYNTASPSEQLTANSATNKLQSAYKYVALNNGQTATVSVYIRKNVGYTGNQPRLVVKANPSAGISSDTVLATYSSGTGSWNQISGTTSAVTEDCVLTFFVDCDTGGSYINIDSWECSLI